MHLEITHVCRPLQIRHVQVPEVGIVGIRIQEAPLFVDHRLWPPRCKPIHDHGPHVGSAALKGADKRVAHEKGRTGETAAHEVTINELRVEVVRQDAAHPDLREGNAHDLAAQGCLENIAPGGARGHGRRGEQAPCRVEHAPRLLEIRLIQLHRRVKAETLRFGIKSRGARLNARCLDVLDSKVTAVEHICEVLQRGRDVVRVLQIHVNALVQICNKVQRVFTSR
mmetsp:Transcript_118472/g.297930  ORF Transcript_118472/g.297930 Transcript_118472/m.297930 type:complete len:225 (-) Transcript_118472:1223-1897(-)